MRTGSPGVSARLAFTREVDVLRDPDGRPRARALDPDALHADGAFALVDVEVHEIANRAQAPHLDRNGFTHVDLRGRPVADLLDGIAHAKRLTAIDQRDLGRALRGRVYPLADGRRMRVLHVAGEGTILRRAGPGGMRLQAQATQRGGSGHDAAVSVHADQDVQGTPIRQLMLGSAPRVFHHDAPTSHNHRSKLHLLNLWFPLRQSTRPLALMDATSLDRKRDQLRFGLDTGRFLKRRASMRVNDIWAFRHHPEQRWFYTPDMPRGLGYAFETLSTPHASFVLPGEQRARRAAEAFDHASQAIEQRDVAGLARVVSQFGDPAPSPPEPSTELDAATWELECGLRQLEDAAPMDWDNARLHTWRTQCARANEALIRMSVELRVVAYVS